MQKRILVFLFGSIITCLMSATTTLSGDKSLLHLYSLSVKNLNNSSLVSEKDILDLCTELEQRTRDAKDYDNMFRIQLIAVNAYCLNGNIGLAVTKSQEMYEEARKLDSALGNALAIQAIATTYMRSNENNQAYVAFGDAEQRLKVLDDNEAKIRLLMQQMHVCMISNRMENLHRYLLQARDLLSRIEIADKDDYLFYAQCYQTYYSIGLKNESLAWLNLQRVNQLKPASGIFDLWYHNLSMRYYELAGDYPRALMYCDSAMLSIQKGGNLNEYKYMMLDKALLLEKNGQKKEACDLYEEVSSLSDSLNTASYIQQVDSLHVRYWVDQMEIGNAVMYNRQLRWILMFSAVIVISGALLIYIVYKRNKRLELSRKKLEEVREETASSIQSKNLFLSNMSHELRTPLNAIVGFSNLLTANDVQDVETRRMCGDLIKQNSELLLKLFDDVANFAALKEDNIRFTFEDTDILSLCRTVVETVEKVKRTSVPLFFETSLEHLQLYTDAGRLQQVLINLLINATKFTKEGKITLKVTIDDERRRVEFAIEDTGCGIPLDKQPHIFNRFEKLHEGVQGAGLGLSICQLIVEHLGGEIRIDSSYTDGARFVFTHPLNVEPEHVSI